MEQRSPRRIGCLVVHGVGYQHRKTGTEESVLRRMGRGTLASIAEIHGSSALEWREVPEERTVTNAAPFGIPAHATAKIRHPNGGEGELLVAEAVWSDGLLQPKGFVRRFLNLRHLIPILPLLLLTVGPDQRDRKVLLDEQVGAEQRGFWEIFSASLRDPFLWGPENRHLVRLMWRLLTLIVFMAAITAVALFHPLVAAGVLGCVAVLLSVCPNPVQQVITVSTHNEAREITIDLLEDRLKWLEAQCDEVVIIAHSQGGYLAHQLLLRGEGRNQTKVTRFVAVGSGLKPIWTLRHARNKFFVVVLWAVPAGMACMLWGTAPVLAPGLTASAAGLLDLGSSLVYLLAHPFVALTPEVMDMAFGGMSGMWWEQVLTSPVFTVAEMTVLHWVATLAGIGLGSLAGVLLVKRVLPNHREELALPTGHGRQEVMEWREYSSVYDMVGRMLLPALPQGVEQEPIPVLGHPVRDHTDYFNPRGMLSRKLAGSFLSDLERSTQQDLGADRWNETIKRYTTTLCEQHDRRRRFHALLMLGVAIVLLTLPIAEGNSLLGAVMGNWVQFAVAMVTLRVVFTWRGRRSHRQVVAALDSELRGTAEPTPLVRVLPLKSRALPSLALVGGALIALCGSAGLAVLGVMNSHVPVPQPGAMLLGAVYLLVLAAAVASGYRIKQEWLLFATLLTASPALLASAPVHSELPLWAVIPGVPAVFWVIASCVVAAFSLRRAVPTSLPEKHSVGSS